jgi:hypothetical protein
MAAQEPLAALVVKALEKISALDSPHLRGGRRHVASVLQKPECRRRA